MCQRAHRLFWQGSIRCADTAHTHIPFSGRCTPTGEGITASLKASLSLCRTKHQRHRCSNLLTSLEQNLHRPCSIRLRLGWFPLSKIHPQALLSTAMRLRQLLLLHHLSLGLRVHSAEKTQPLIFLAVWHLVSSQRSPLWPFQGGAICPFGHSLRKQ